MGLEVPTLCSLRYSISISLALSTGDLLSFGTVRHERVQCCYAKQRQRFKQPTLMAADMAFNVAMLVFSVAMLFQLCMQTCSIAALSSARLLISTMKWNFSPCNKTFILMKKNEEKVHLKHSVCLLRATQRKVS